MPEQDFVGTEIALFARRWWAVVLKGLVALGFGVFAFVRPGVTLAFLVLLFGAYALCDGIVSLFGAILGRRQQDYRWLLALEGIVGIWVGVLTLRAPQVTALVLVFFVSMWAMVTGFLRIAAAIRLRREISGEFLMGLSGVLSVLFALLLILRPLSGAVGLVWLIAGYAVILGIVLVLLGMELRGARPRHA
jgi:uncharacterized membrane protein HdeD (DUF308 family)